jgi:Concanavalin A-like lectin/glucanases superfamily
MGGGANHGMLTYTWNGNSGATYGFVSGLTPPDSKWSFVAVVIDPTKAVLYLDAAGVLTSATNAIAHINEAWGGNANIGADPTYTVRNVNGMVDEVAVFNYAMTSQQVQNLYAGVAQAAQPRLSVSAATGGQITISWSGSGTLQSTPALKGASTVWTTAGTTSPVTVTAKNAATFYRVQGQ